MKGDGGGVEGNKAVKPVTAVRVCVSTFVTVKLQDVFDKEAQHLISKHVFLTKKRKVATLRNNKLHLVCAANS